jgi:MSHA pilin protein MshD
MSSKRLCRHAGFTMIELIIFIVVVSVGIVGILSVSSRVVASSADPMVRKQAAALADAVLEEILQKSYAHDPNAAVGTDRNSYDNVSDYNGLTEAAFTDLPASLTTPPGNYTIAISVAAPSSEDGVTMKKVTVVVSRGSESVTIVGYRANY